MCFSCAHLCLSFLTVRTAFPKFRARNKRVLDQFLLGCLFGEDWVGVGGGSDMFSIGFVWACCHVGESNCHRTTVHVISPNVFPNMPQSITVVISIHSLTLETNSLCTTSRLSMKTTSRLFFVLLIDSKMVLLLLRSQGITNSTHYTDDKKACDC